MTQDNKTYHCFDWDDNLFFMPTNIILFHKDTHEEIILSTEDFAHYRGEIGKEYIFYTQDNKIVETGDLRNFADFKIIGDDKHPVLNSFREFRDCEKEYFNAHIKEALARKAFGPEWELFIEATATKKEAEKVYIITARGQSDTTIYNGIKLLKELGLIKNHIPKKNIFPVSHSKFKGQASSPQALKLKMLKNICTEANKLAKKEQIHHTVYFSDDDLKTVSYLREKLTNLRENEMNSLSYWKHIHIRLRYTGTKKSSTMEQGLISL